MRPPLPQQAELIEQQKMLGTVAMEIASRKITSLSIQLHHREWDVLRAKRQSLAQEGDRSTQKLTLCI